MKRFNKFTYIISVEGQNFLYDISSETAIALHPHICKIITANSSDADAIKIIHPELFENMVSVGILVDDNFDDAAELIEHFKAADRSPEQFSIIVNPTLDCNLRCWYCYETHGRGTMMNSETRQAVERLIDIRLSDKRLRELNLSFFGGEPIIGWRKVVIPLLSYATKQCHAHGVKFSTGFTTNGVLITENKLDELSALGLVDTSFQITLDGNRTIHNSSRIGEAKIPTYDIILKNVRLAAEKGFNVTLRFNFTPETMPSFLDVLSDISEFPAYCRKNIHCSFQQVWQTTVSATKVNEAEYVRLFTEAGFSTSCDIMYWRHLCYADRENQITINYNGDLFKCTAREFNPAMREGILMPDGTLSLNDRYRQRMNAKYANTACHECPLMPLCNGQCSQGKLENPDYSSCRMNYDVETQRNIIAGSFYYTVFGKLLSFDEIKQKVITLKRIS